MIENLLVPSREDGSEAIHPAVGSFNDPSPSTMSAVAPPLALLASRTDVWKKQAEVKKVSGERLRDVLGGYRVAARLPLLNDICQPLQFVELVSTLEVQR